MEGGLRMDGKQVVGRRGNAPFPLLVPERGHGGDT